MEKKRNGIMIAGTGSGCGKTTIVCGIMRALTKRGILVTPFKCGPDYIDPMLHTYITNRPSHNLDGFFMDEESLKQVFSHSCLDESFAIVEGVMGFYDGIGVSSQASSYEVAEILDLPTILVVSVRGMSATVSAIIKGMLTYRPNQIKGIILNQCSKGMYEKLKLFLKEETGIPVLGYLPINKEIQIKERHLGLMTAQEIENLDGILQTLQTVVEENFDIDQLLSIGTRTEKPVIKRGQKVGTSDGKEKQQSELHPITIGVAKDEAFCFCYEDNKQYLKEQGVSLTYFSPIYDEELPKNIGALYFPGGYPELYAKELQQNESMKKSIRLASQRGIPIIAECGGYMYLCQTVKTSDNEKDSYAMVGIIPQEIVMTKTLNMHFGYIVLTAKQDGLLAKKGEQVKGHEFHYSKEKEELHGFLIEKPDKSRSWDGVYHTDTIYAGYPHFHFRSNSLAIKRFLKKAEEFLML